MRVSLKSVLFVTSFAVFIGVVTAQGQGQAGQAAQAGQAQVPARPQNLQVLPKDWTLQQVQQQMRTIAASLGVECTHCHVGTNRERARDDNPKKAIGRQMLRMTAAINNEMLKGVGEPAPAGTAKVTCYTCHRGALKPLTAPAGSGN